MKGLQRISVFQRASNSVGQNRADGAALGRASRSDDKCISSIVGASAMPLPSASFFITSMV